MKARFDELLPFYVNETLSEADRAWVEDYLREHPKSGAELDWYRSLQKKLHEDAPVVASEIGLERALHRIRTEGPMPEGARRAPAARGSALEALRAWLSSLVPQPLLKPALAAAFAVVVVQSGVIAHLAGGDEATELRAVPAQVTDAGPYLRINFKPDAREADMRMLLVEAHGSLAAGPGQLGDYYLRVPAAQIGAVTERLKASPIVDGVAIVDALPRP